MIPVIPDACLLCGSAESATLLAFERPDQYELAVGVGGEGYSRRWVKCMGCGFHFSQYSREAGVIDRVYEDAYRNPNATWRHESTEDTFKKVIALSPGQSESKARVAWVKAHVASARRAGGLETSAPPWRILDIGGATGAFAHEFKDAEWRAEVMDPSSAGRFLAERFDIPYHERSLTKGVLAPEYDLISLVYTLEHLADPFEALKAAAEGLRAGGLLFVEVPDAIAFRLKMGDDDIFNACHLWMFDPVSLAQLLARCGYELFALERTHTVRGHYGLMALAGRR